MAAVLCIVGEAMNERIKEFAERAGFAVYGWNENEFEKFADLVAAHEREECAKMFDDQDIWAKEIPQTIRARGNDDIRTA